jgi:hypothetical protein
MTAEESKEFFRPYRLIQEDPNGVGTGLGVMPPAEAQDFFQAGRLQQPDQLQRPREQRHSITTGEGSLAQSFVKEEKSANKKTLRHFAKKAEMPSGAGIPRPPKPPMAPKPPVAPGKQPKAQADKQAQMSARGKQQKPPKPKVTQQMPGMKKSIGLSEEYIYAPCPHCNTPEFKKTENGPKFAPCACFAIEAERKQFVKLNKTESGYKLEFDPKADPESVKAFLLTLKLGLLAKRFGKNNE